MHTPTDDLLDARAAAALLGVKRATLYAYVSRGLLVAQPGPGREKRYLRAEVARLLTRAASAASPATPRTVPAIAGLEVPAVASAVTAIGPGGPSYRGRAALDLAAADVGFEATAELLWRGVAEADDELWRGAPPLLDLALEMLWLPDGAAPFDAMRLSLALLDGKRPPSGPRAEAIERADARRIIRLLASAAGVARDPAAASAALDAPTVAAGLAASFGVAGSEPIVRALDRALVLVADHGVDVASYTARVVASTGAELSACLLAAAAAQSGPRHGGASARIEGLIDEALTLATPAEVLARRHASGAEIPGFGHPRYPGGDPRGAALLVLARGAGSAAPPTAAAALAIAEGMARGGQPAPNVAFGLVALARALGLPHGAAQALFVVGRAAGWVAHVLEQRSQGGDLGAGVALAAG